MNTETENKITISDEDYTELLIRNLARSKEVYDKAVQYRLTGSDFMVDEVFGVQLYKEFIDSIMSLGGPVDMQLLASNLNTKFADKTIVASQYDDALALLDFVYNENITPKYFTDTLKEFLKKKRVAKVTIESEGKPDQLISNLNALNIDLSVDDVMAKAVNIHPFVKPIFKHKQEMIGTGLMAIDEHATGLCMGDYGIVVGYSGGGKTVLAANIVSNNAIVGVPAMFISCEEDEVQISQRFYSKFFDIPYTDLHKGMANQTLEEVFKDPTLESKRRDLANNLALLGLKGLTPVTADQIFELMVRKFESTAFVPSVVVIDQLQFIEPMAVRKSMASWELEKVAAAELDELSHKTIGGRKFALWVMHQAKGKLRRRFSREEIDGFKGIIHKADLVLGIGRDGINANEVDIFSLKVRHCQDFGVTIGAEFRFMRFIDRTRASLSMAGYSTATSNPSELPPLPDELPAPPSIPETVQ